MTRTPTFEKAVEIAKVFANRVYEEFDSQAVVYLYGSTTKGQNRPGSDIDIAVVSKLFTDDVCNNYAVVNLIAFEVDDSIDAQAIIYDDWVYKTPFTAEVEKQGVLITR
jgi:predicted nucleotidyltransferase